MVGDDSLPAEREQLDTTGGWSYTNNPSLSFMSTALLNKILDVKRSKQNSLTFQLFFSEFLGCADSSSDSSYHLSELAMVRESATGQSLVDVHYDFLAKNRSISLPYQL
uniref:MATH domain-containing protein n=1 Tax=Angiostrongylus cantonensis TaxID=6313 RepID=A0A0K0CX56_ANGCA